METTTSSFVEKKVVFVKITPKPTRWARIKLFFCGMPDGTILHGEKIVSIPDLVNLEKNTSTLKKVIHK